MIINTKDILKEQIMFLKPMNNDEMTRLFICSNKTNRKFYEILLKRL